MVHRKVLTNAYGASEKSFDSYSTSSCKQSVVRSDAYAVPYVNFASSFVLNVSSSNFHHKICFKFLSSSCNLTRRHVIAISAVNANLYVLKHKTMEYKYCCIVGPTISIYSKDTSHPQKNTSVWRTVGSIKNRMTSWVITFLCASCVFINLVHMVKILQ